MAHLCRNLQEIFDDTGWGEDGGRSDEKEPEERDESGEADESVSRTKRTGPDTRAVVATTAPTTTGRESLAVPEEATNHPLRQVQKKPTATETPAFAFVPFLVVFRLRPRLRAAPPPLPPRRS